MSEVNYRNEVKYKKRILALALVLVAVLLASVFLGQFAITPRELLGIVGSRFMDIVGSESMDIAGSEFINIEPFWSEQSAHVFWSIRLPRIMLACVVGVALSTAGLVYQNVFENPMASPDFLGASSGAAFGAALAIILGFGGVALTASAFVFSLLTILLVYIIGSKAKGYRTIGLVLAGLMVSSIAQAGTCFIKLVADQTNQLPAITYWMMGSLASAKSQDLIFAAAVITAGLVPIWLLRWKLSVLTVGEDEAASMGVNVTRVRFISLVAATLVTAAAVSVSGVIGWVGLVVPHFCRKIVGNNLKYLMPAVMISGAAFMLAVDDVSRCLLAIEIPIGILTALIGAPFFLYLIAGGGDE